MQSIINDANISILNVSVLDSVIGIEAKTKETSGEVAGTDFNLGTRKKRRDIFRETLPHHRKQKKKQNRGGGVVELKSEEEVQEGDYLSGAVRVRKVREAEAAGLDYTDW